MSPFDLETLKAAVARGEAFTYRPFFGHTPRPDGALSDACFSQWWASPFTVEGVRYETAEQYMMAAKARLFGDDAALRQILAEADPSQVKALGRAVTPFDGAAWAAARFDAVTAGSIAKFTATSALREYLLATGDAVLVEAAPRDQIWGIGLGRENPRVLQPAQWRGQNLLGFALMRARRAISSGGLDLRSA